MTNTAKILNFGRGNFAEQELRVADIDDGYTRFANELLEAIASADLTARQLKVMLAYVRKTYGFNKKTDRIADEQIAQLTGLSRQNVNKAKKELISMNCLFMDGNQIGVNREVSAWQFSKCLQVSNFVSKLETKNVSKLETLNVSKLETHKRHSLKTKENINKPPKSPKQSSFDPAGVELPEWLSVSVWKSWVDYRRDLKKPIKSQQTVTQAINLLERCKCSGYQPEEIINQSIANGWQGLFEPKGAKQPSRTPSRVSENFAGKDYGQTEIPAWARD
ncbi:replication protein [Escherichia coli]|nr:replication protein [Escherichia coli]